MPLYDITAYPSHVDPTDAENYIVLQRVKKNLPPATFARIIKTVEEAIDWAESTGANRLVWTKSAALFGYNNLQPTARVNHLWENIKAAVGENKHCLMAVGGFLRWRISLRNDTWLVYRQDNADGKTDPETGKIITVSEYWINNNFKYEPKPKKQKLDISGLTDAWGAR